MVKKWHDLHLASLLVQFVADQWNGNTSFDNVYVAAKKLSEEQTRRTTEHKGKLQEAAVHP